MTEATRCYPEGDAVRRHYAEEWERQIINAGGDENIAKQAVTLAALNGLFDPIGVAQGQPTLALNIAEISRQIDTDPAIPEGDRQWKKGYKQACSDIIVSHLAAREDEQVLRRAREALLASEGVPLSDG